MNTLVCLIPALPLAAAVLLALMGKKRLGESGHWVALAGTGGACLCSLLLLLQVRGMADSEVGAERIVRLWTWSAISPGAPAWGGNAAPGEVVNAKSTAQPDLNSLDVEVVLRADPLSSIMLVMVTFVASLVIYYASGYMHGDPGYNRFFVFVSLFVFSMTVLVSVSNFLLLYMGWELVGACSYLLIGFWYHKPEAAAASKKAFLVNRIGDFGFALGIFLLWITYGTLDFHDTVSSAGAATQLGVLGQTRLTHPDMYVGGAMGTAIILLLFVGACGKSAQFPLHVWLPDAMEGPTPVSALIHAATMVTAGVYMVARCAPLLVVSPHAQVCVSVIGGATAFLAGFIAITQTDLKRVLAYSTISQLGFMFLSLGTGSSLGIAAGMFHLFTHAFFKALLFLGAGSVMHAMGGVIDFRRFGGLRHIMPATHGTFLIGCLALSGIAPLAGFWSKDQIFVALHDRAFGPSQHSAPAAHARMQESNALSHFSSRRALAAGTGRTAVFHAVNHRLHDDAQAHAVGDHGADHASGKGTEAKNAAAAPFPPSQDAFRGVYQWLYYMAMLTAGMTAYYTFRAYFQTFYGDLKTPDEAGGHAHESPPNMVFPLLVLSVFAVLVGWLLEQTHAFSGLLLRTPSLAAITHDVGHHGFHWDIAMATSVVALLGIGLAAFFYLGETSEIEGLTQRMLPLYDLSRNQAYLDSIYAAIFVAPLKALARFFAWGDRFGVDRIVDIVGAIPGSVGWYLRPLQPGLIQFYALGMALGAIILMAALFRFGG